MKARHAAEYAAENWSDDGSDAATGDEPADEDAEPAATSSSAAAAAPAEAPQEKEGRSDDDAADDDGEGDDGADAVDSAAFFVDHRIREALVNTDVYALFTTIQKAAQAPPPRLSAAPVSLSLRDALTVWIAAACHAQVLSRLLRVAATDARRVLCELMDAGLRSLTEHALLADLRRRLHAGMLSDPLDGAAAELPVMVAQFATHLLRQGVRARGDETVAVFFQYLRLVIVSSFHPETAAARGFLDIESRAWHKRFDDVRTSAGADAIVARASGTIRAAATALVACAVTACHAAFAYRLRRATKRPGVLTNAGTPVVRSAFTLVQLFVCLRATQMGSKKSPYRAALESGVFVRGARWALTAAAAAVDERDAELRLGFTAMMFLGQTVAAVCNSSWQAYVTATHCSSDGSEYPPSEKAAVPPFVFTPPGSSADAVPAPKVPVPLEELTRGCHDHTPFALLTARKNRAAAAKEAASLALAAEWLDPWLWHVHGATMKKTPHVSSYYSYYSADTDDSDSVPRSCRDYAPPGEAWGEQDRLPLWLAWTTATTSVARCIGAALASRGRQAVVEHMLRRGLDFPWNLARVVGVFLEGAIPEGSGRMRIFCT